MWQNIYNEHEKQHKTYLKYHYELFQSKMKHDEH